MNILRHLFIAYRAVFAWFWGIMLLIIAGVATSFSVFGHYTLDDARVSVWDVVGQQGPRWFLFVMGIMYATVNLPVVIAHGITRRAYYRAAMVFIGLTALGFTLVIMLGFAVEYVTYTTNGMMDNLNSPYPITTWTDAFEYSLVSLLVLAGFSLSGWLVGLT